MNEKEVILKELETKIENKEVLDSLYNVNSTEANLVCFRGLNRMTEEQLSQWEEVIS